jgi:arylsulfatase A-like enzyme
MKTFYLVLGAVFSLATLPVAAAAEQPNLIIILSDDAGYGDHSVHGHPRIDTPNIDHLSTQSVRFTDYHVNTICSPTRAELMTGVTAYRNGSSTAISGLNVARIDLPMMPQYFKDNGYATAQIGKWHLGDSYPFRPHDRGFDHSIRYNSFGLHTIAGHWENSAFDDHGWQNNEPIIFKGYNTDFFFEEAESWVGQQEKPFFLLLATTAPHAPLYVPSRYEKPFEDLGKLLAAYFGMMINLDDNVGRLMKYLDESGLSENTIVIYMTDNGSRERSGFYGAGMRGTKGSLYEGGHRVPFFIRWPDGIEGHPHDIGEPRDIDVLTHSTDLLPTLLELMNLNVNRPADFEGHSLVPVLEGQADPFPDRKVVIQWGSEFEKYDLSAVLWKKWRLVEGQELYNLATDPGQERDLAVQRDDVVQILRNHYDEWAEGTMKVMHPDNYVIVGSSFEPVTALTAEGWTGPRLSDWKYIAKINTPQYGYWKIEAAESGNFEVLFYLFPPEADAALTQSLRNVPSRPITGARLLLDDKEYTIQTSSSATHARFTIPLIKGEKHHIEGQFLNAEGKPIVGSFFARLRKVSSL